MRILPASCPSWVSDALLVAVAGFQVERPVVCGNRQNNQWSFGLLTPFLGLQLSRCFLQYFFTCCALCGMLLYLVLSVFRSSRCVFPLSFLYISSLAFSVFFFLLWFCLPTAGVFGIVVVIVVQSGGGWVMLNFIDT